MSDSTNPNDQQDMTYREKKNALRQQLEELDQKKRDLESEFKKLARVEEANFTNEIAKKIIDFSQAGMDIDVDRLLEKISNKVNRRKEKSQAKATKGSAKTATANAAKYRNPNDSSQTWTGKGRKPGWVVDSLNNGKVLDDLLIEPSEHSENPEE